ncbi:MAG: aminopeptidase P family protein [Rhodothalassiaceae bacterium]
MSAVHADRLAALRREMEASGVDAFIVPLTDEHGSEYVADYARRLAWLTGFTGSAGTAVILAKRAALFIDGRYVLQAAQEVDDALYERVQVETTPPLDWVEAHVEAGARVGYDPRLHSIGWVEDWQARLARRGAELTALEANPVDAIWSEQPPRPPAPAVPHGIAFAGEESAAKRRRIMATVRDKGAKGLVLTMLDAIAWLFNIRGTDVPHTPVVLAYALLHEDATATLFLAPEKATPELADHLGSEVTLAPYDAFYDRLRALDPAAGPLLVDPASANAAVFSCLAEAGVGIVRDADPCALAKACKNPVEIAGTRAAHVRDGAALTEFLHWLDREAPGGGLDEMSAAEKLVEFRRRRPHFRDLSFDTISGAGPNGAIVHYRVSENSRRPIRPGEIYLVDSGAQYLDGTTDITRTVPIGEVGAEERDRFTRVLKGHIALATLRFPRGTTGAQIDALARRPLWDAGLDYDHGTGHGVGSYLAVHEGPQRIAKLPNATPLQPGMIVSDEPGYYRSGAYGIRIENLVLVVADEAEAERPFLRFETLSLAPIDRRLILPGLLDARERDWLDRYHARVREMLMPEIADAAARDWLDAMTAPIAG